MPNTILCDLLRHKNILLEDFGHGLAVQANQHLIVHNGQGMVLDPGGHKAFGKAIAETTALVGTKLLYVFLSHQDPDIVAATNGWLMATDAQAYISKLWLRFLPHFGIDRLVEGRIKDIPDEGMILNLAGLDLLVLPAHFLHSPGNFHVYDPLSKILYSGDLGASFGGEYPFVTDFAGHVKFMEGFHRRTMASGKVLKAWVRMVRPLDIEFIAPQHGGVFRGKPMVAQFLDWCETLECGVDTIEGLFRLPGA
jgi:flavorubredoxin